MRELLGQVREGGTSASPELDFGECCGGGSLALGLAFEGLLYGFGPGLHCGDVVFHEVGVFDVAFDGSAERNDREFNGDCSGDLD